MSERTVHVSISGRVQGVGYRAWTERQAIALGLSGWVRNRSDGTVEAVFSGAPADVEAMIAGCRHGPSAAHVDAVLVTEAAPLAEKGFRTLPTL